MFDVGDGMLVSSQYAILVLNPPQAQLPFQLAEDIHTEDIHTEASDEFHQSELDEVGRAGLDFHSHSHN